MRRTEIEHLLPGIFQRTVRPGSPLWAILQAMEALHAPAEDILDQLDATFKPYWAAERFVPFLAGWVDLGKLLAESSSAADGAELLGAPAAAAAPFAPGLGRLRELVAAAAFLSQWRGTARGLLRFLETATGVRGFDIDELVAGVDGRPRPFHLRICAPPEARPYRALMERIIEIEKPAYVTYELVLNE